MKRFLLRVVTFYTVTLLYLCGAVTFIALLLLIQGRG